MNIEQLINKKFNTDKGVLYFIELLHKEFPTLKMNLEVLPKLNVVEMSEEYYQQTGFVAEFVYDRSEIKLLTKSEGTDRLTEDEILKSFFHELVHAVSSKSDEKYIYEGLNIRDKNTKENSPLLGLNEGITQYIVNKVLGEQKDVYPYQTLFAAQLATIIGDDNLMECYSNNSNVQLQEILSNSVSCFSPEDFGRYVQLINIIPGFFDETFYRCELGLCLKMIQDITIKWYNSSEKTENTIQNFEDLILTSEKAKEIQIISLMPYDIFGLEALDELEEIKGVGNGKQ